MYPIDLGGKKGLIFGVANNRSIAWAIAQILNEAGVQLALAYQNERFRDRVSKLAETLDNALLLECDVTKDEVDLLRDFFGLTSKELRLILAEDIGDDTSIRKVFSL